MRQLAAAFKNGPICPFFNDSLESGSKLPHSEGFASQKLCGISRDGGAPRKKKMKMKASDTDDAASTLGYSPFINMLWLETVDKITASL